MFDPLRTRLLVWLHVPPEPQAPAGAPGSTRIFRAGRRFYQLRVARWAIAQAVTLAGILFSLWFFHRAEQIAQELRAAAAKVAPASVTPSPENPPPAPRGKSASGKTRAEPKVSVNLALKRMAERTPWWMFRVITVLEIMTLCGFAVLLVVTFATVRLDYEQRWYIVTDRSLRLRSGLWLVQELTMSFANLQQVVVSQGPLQRLLGLADVHVQSAGGGGASAGDTHDAANSLHTAVFHSVENAHEIRDLILERLRIFRATGLGDPDDHHAAAAPLPASSASPAATSHAASADTLAAARELLTEARALRRTFGP
jgi:membrane protein YdbS with pleckstrin-like domain